MKEKGDSEKIVDICLNLMDYSSNNILVLENLAQAYLDLYEQEKGNNQANGTAIVASLTTGSIEIGNGDQFMSVSKFVPDFTDLSKELTVTLTLEDYPQSTTSQTTSGNVSSTTQKINVRGRGRSVKLNFLTNVADETNWRLGSMKLQLRPDGRR